MQYENNLFFTTTKLKEQQDYFVIFIYLFLFVWLVCDLWAYIFKQNY